MNFDWGDLDRRADWIIRKYSLVTGAWNVLPPPLDMMGAAGTFSKMATELAGVYQVMMPARAPGRSDGPWPRARPPCWGSLTSGRGC